MDSTAEPHLLSTKTMIGMLFNEITVEEFAEIRAREAYEDGEKAGYYEGGNQRRSFGAGTRGLRTFERGIPRGFNRCRC